MITMQNMGMHLQLLFTVNLITIRRSADPTYRRTPACYTAPPPTPLPGIPPHRDVEAGCHSASPSA